MRQIGTVVRLQVQESSLKVGEKPRRYDPAPLRAVTSLDVTPAGVSATGHDGQVTIDVHNQNHPASKNSRGVNGISLGFTTHYAAMRNRFGPHLTDGIAGENVLIATDRSFEVADLAQGLIISGDGRQPLMLRQVIVAAPCVEFSRYALRFPDDQRPDATVTQALQFLHNGMRGFYATADIPRTVISVGDQVFLA